MTFKSFVFVIFGIWLIIQMLCTVVELMLAGGFGGLVERPSLPWLIGGWCLFLALFYAVRKIFKGWEEQENDQYF